MNRTEHKGDAVELLFRAAVPAQVRRELAEVVGSDEEFRLAVTTDIKLDGLSTARAWLMATDDHLVAFSSDSGGPPDMVCLPLNEISGVEVREDWGTAALKVRTEERGATMAVFSKSLVPALSELPNQVERLVKQARSTETDGQVLHGRLAGARAGRKPLRPLRPSNSAALRRVPGLSGKGQAAVSAVGLCQAALAAHYSEPVAHGGGHDHWLEPALC